jgi:hypothetical protein
LKNKALIILILAVFSEYAHLLFAGHIHSYYIRAGIKTPIYWDDIMYYFFNELFTLVIIGYLLAGATTRAAKSIYTGLVVWFLIEFIEITLQAMGISNARLFINDGSWLQLTTCLTIVLLILFMNKKISS